MVGNPLGVGNATYESIWRSVEGINSSSPRPGGGTLGTLSLPIFTFPRIVRLGDEMERDIGGRGGLPIRFCPDGSRIFFGDGAVDANDFVLEGGGGNGGGVIFVMANTIKDISVDGGKGGATYSTSPCVDCLTGPGGGMIWIDPFEAEKNSSMMSLLSEWKRGPFQQDRRPSLSSQWSHFWGKYDTSTNALSTTQLWWLSRPMQNYSSGGTKSIITPSISKRLLITEFYKIDRDSQAYLFLHSHTVVHLNKLAPEIPVVRPSQVQRK